MRDSIILWSGSVKPSPGALIRAAFSLVRFPPESDGKKQKPPDWVAFIFLAEDEGFEPPQTESESGVLPLHKSSICGTFILYPII